MHSNDYLTYDSARGYVRPRPGFGRHARKVIITAAIMAGLLAPVPALAQKGNSSEVNPTPTTEVTRNERGSSQERLRGEVDFTLVNYRSDDYLGGFRMDMDTERTAEFTVDMFSDPEMIEDNLDLYYEDDFRVRGIGYCTGVELYEPETGMTLYAVACADDEYVNFVMGTNKADVLDGIGQMQDGYVPDVDGYVEVD